MFLEEREREREKDANTNVQNTFSLHNSTGSTGNKNINGEVLVAMTSIIPRCLMLFNETTVTMTTVYQSVQIMVTVILQSSH